jgi:DNA polymerase
MFNTERLVGLDFETYCALSLPDVGLARYVAHPTFKVTLASVATYTGTTTIEFPGSSGINTTYLKDLLQGMVVSAHNAGFEDAVLDKLDINYGFNLVDSAVVAAVAGADRHLAGSAQQLMQVGKLDEDRSLLNLFAKKQKDQVDDEFDMTLVINNPDKWEEYKKYCERDAELSRGIILDWHGDPALFDREMRFAQLTLEMNKAGWPVDVESVELMRERYLDNLDQLKRDFEAVDADLNLDSHVQVKKWCADRGVRSNSFDRQNVERLIRVLVKKQGSPMGLTPGQSDVLNLLLTKQALGGSSLKKLETILATQYNGRVYDQYVHAGAPQSLRTSGRSIQMQNLPRLEHVRHMGDLRFGSSTWTNEELSGNLRQVFTASDPKGQLLVADFASIESRALAYMANEQWKVQAYRNGQDVYKAQALKIFRLSDINTVTKEQRTTGKVGELSCGYGAGPVAVKDFAAKMHVDLTEGEASKLVADWRDANPNTVQFWYALGDALYKTVETGQMHSVPAAGSHMAIKFLKADTPASLVDQVPGVQSIQMNVWMRGRKIMSRVFHGCYLRGRNIGYYKPSSLKGGRPWKATYVDPKTKRSKYYELYGGKIAGILTQSLCREIFFEALEDLHSILRQWDNATIIGQFHDEVVVDWVPGRVSMRAVEAAMQTTMSSSNTHPALPMGVEVKHDYRYTK